MEQPTPATRLQLLPLDCWRMMLSWTRSPVHDLSANYIFPQAMDEASSFKFGEPVRQLFLSLLVLNHPSDPLKFYSDHRLLFSIIKLMMMTMMVTGTN